MGEGYKAPATIKGPTATTEPTDGQVAIWNSTLNDWQFVDASTVTGFVPPPTIEDLVTASQGAAIADATSAPTVITQLNLLLAFLRNRGDIDT